MVDACLGELRRDQEATRTVVNSLADRLDVLTMQIREMQENSGRKWDGLQLRLAAMAKGMQKQGEEECEKQSMKWTRGLTLRPTAEPTPMLMDRGNSFTKLGFPDFDGTDLEDWVDKCEHYFEREQTGEANKVKIASVYTFGKAFQWHYAFIRNSGCSDLPLWTEYVEALTKCFGKGVVDDPMEKLKELKQQESLRVGKDVRKDEKEKHEVVEGLGELAEIFQESTALPPNKQNDHSIVIQGGVQEICVGPYKHSVTQQEKVPIPVIEELRNELHGSTVLSKIDLRLRYHQLRMNPGDVHKVVFRTHVGHYEFLRSKCLSVCRGVEYVGHCIVKDGVTMDPQRVTAVAEWLVPINLKQLRGFLEWSGRYRGFIKGYGTASRSLANLLKKDLFQWNEEAQAVLDSLKLHLTTAPTLALSDLSKDLVVETDASNLGIRAVLLQDRHHFDDELVIWERNQHCRDKTFKRRAVKLAEYGTTPVVIVAAEFLKRANDLVRNKIHPTSIINGYRLATRKSCDSDFFANLVVDAVQAVKMTNAWGEVKYPIKGIIILKAYGKSAKDSYLLNGYAWKTGRATQGMPIRVASAKIACLDFNLQKTKIRISIQDLSKVAVQNPNPGGNANRTPVAILQRKMVKRGNRAATRFMKRKKWRPLRLYGDGGGNREGNVDRRLVYDVLRELVRVIRLVHWVRFLDFLECLISVVAEIPSNVSDFVFCKSEGAYREMTELCRQILRKVLTFENGKAEEDSVATEVLKSLSWSILEKYEARAFLLRFLGDCVEELGSASGGLRRAVVNLPKYFAQKVPEKSESRAEGVESIIEVVNMLGDHERVNFFDYVLRLLQVKNNLKILAVDLIMDFFMNLRDLLGTVLDGGGEITWGVKFRRALIQRFSDSGALIRARALSNLEQLVGILAENERSHVAWKEVLCIGDGSGESLEDGIYDVLRKRFMDEKALVRSVAINLVNKLTTQLRWSFDGVVVKTIGMACSGPLASIRATAASALSEKFLDAHLWTSVFKRGWT